MLKTIDNQISNESRNWNITTAHVTTVKQTYNKDKITNWLKLNILFFILRSNTLKMKAASRLKNPATVMYNFLCSNSKDHTWIYNIVKFAYKDSKHLVIILLTISLTLSFFFGSLWISMKVFPASQLTAWEIRAIKKSGIISFKEGHNSWINSSIWVSSL